MNTLKHNNQSPENQDEIILVNKRVELNFTQVENELLECTYVSRDARFLYLLLLRFCQKKDYCFPGTSLLRELLGNNGKVCGKSQFEHYLKELEKVGLVRREKKSGKATRYYLYSLPDKYICNRKYKKANLIPKVDLSQNRTSQIQSDLSQNGTTTSPKLGHEEYKLEKYKISIIDSEKIESEVVDNSEDGAQQETKPIQEIPEIINYASLSSEKKLQAISVKFAENRAKNSNPFDALKENLEKLKSEEEVKKQNRGGHSRYASKQPAPHLKRTKSRGADNLLVPKKNAPQIANKTLPLEILLEVQEAEKQVESIKTLAEDTSRKLSDTKNRKKNITHMGNIYRKAKVSGYSFQNFLDIAIAVRRDTQERENVRNKGAYFFKAFEQRLGLAERDGGGS